MARKARNGKYKQYQKFILQYLLEEKHGTTTYSIHRQLTSSKYFDNNEILEKIGGEIPLRSLYDTIKIMEEEGLLKQKSSISGNALYLTLTSAGIKQAKNSK